ncbi:MAG TPA: hypothetical protein VMZ91_00315 [Candidatus Paceibacterota bacterium]|nr:hypothetical protein [Candidatus Paceibacterota bacterium]
MGKAKEKIRKKRCGRSKRKERANAFENIANASLKCCYAKFVEKIKDLERIEKELKQNEIEKKRMIWKNN